MEIINAANNPDDPSNWQASSPGGSPGKPNLPSPASAPRIVINEWQAGQQRDWIELFNPGTIAVSLADWSLTDNSDPRQFVFPANIQIEGGGFLRVECVGSSATGALEAPFRLNRQGETIALYNQLTNRVAVVQYGPVVDGFTIGIINGSLALCDPTPLSANEAASLGPRTAITLNEFLSNPEDGDDWLELHNTGTAPVSLFGCSILTSNALARIESAVFIGPGSFVVLRADENPGPNHLDLKLPANRGLISLLGPDGAELDRVVYGTQLPEISLGRLPDGTGAWQSLGFSPTPGASNYLANLGNGLRFSEVLARAEPGPDWIEVENGTPAPLALTGHTLRANPPQGPPIETVLPSIELRPGARFVIYYGAPPAEFNPLPGSVFVPSPLPDDGAVLSLHETRGRILDRIEYRKQIPNRSIGRSGAQWTLLAAGSPGLANLEPALLDLGQGIRINEWLAAGGGTNDFIELYNPAPRPVHLLGWVVTDDPSIRGTTNNRLGDLFFIDAGGFVHLQTDGNEELGPLHTDFRLNRLGETLRLLDPSGRIVDTLDYRVQLDQVSEGRYPDGSTVFLRFPGSASPGAANFLLSNDADADGMEDDWERRFGLDPAFAGDAASDADNDGVSNLDEFQSGTDPRNATDQLRAILIVTEGGQLGIRFTAQPGRAYQVQASDSLGRPEWRVVGTWGIQNVLREVTITDPDRFDHRPTRFYRIQSQRASP